MMNDIKTWQQGQFVDQKQYDKMGDMWKDEKAKEEKHNVRSGLTENAVCWCPDPSNAKWIASRLNLASRLEQMSYDFATGKTDGQEMIDFVKSNVQ